MRLVWVFAIAACGGGKDRDAATQGSGSSGPGSGSSGPGAPKPTLSVKLDGAPLALERAFIKRVSPDQWRLLVGDKEGSCEELLSGVTNRQAGATSFVATIRRRLTADGKLATAVSDFWSAGHPTDAKYGAATLSLPADGATPRGKKISVELAPIVDIDGPKKLEISGTLVADGCGDHPDSGAGVPKAPHASKATITIAGHKLPLRGAIVDGGNVILSTGPKDCSSTPYAQIVLTHAKGAWELSGTWIPEPKSVSDNVPLKANADSMRPVTHEPGAKGTSPDGPTVQLSLGGGTGRIGGYRIELDGGIEAIDCTPPPKPRP